MLGRQIESTRDDALAGVADNAQIFVKTQAETYHTEVKEDADGQHQSRDDIHPLAAERPCVGMSGNNGIVVQLCQYQLVSRVAQVFDSRFECCIYFLYFL